MSEYTGKMRDNHGCLLLITFVMICLLLLIDYVISGAIDQRLRRLEINAGLSTPLPGKGYLPD